MSPDLTQLLQDPARVVELPPAEARRLLLPTSALVMALATRAAEAPADGPPEVPVEGDRALTIEEAARLLSTSVDTLYRKWRKFPFAWKDPVDGHVKFSHLGIQKHLRQRQGR